MSIIIKGGNSANLADVTPAGEMKVALNTGVFGAVSVSMDPTVAFYDTFEGTTLDTVNRWSTFGTVAPVQNQGNININPGVAANASTVAVSQPLIPINTTMVMAGLITFESSVALGNHRFWGFANTAGNLGTAAAPITDGIGFEVDTTGTLRASVYNTGNRVFTQSLAMPTDGQPHVYMIQSRGDMTVFYMNDLTTPLAVTFATAASQVLAMRMASLNSAGVTGTPTFQVQGFSILDLSRQASQLADGLLPWRKAKVDTTGSLSTVGRAADLCVTSTAGAGFATVATLPAAGPGLFHYITNIDITKFAGAALTPVATPTVVTTSNLPGGLAWSFATAQTVGTTIDRDETFTGAPLRSSVANTATVISAPAVTTVVWRLTVHYYTGT